MKTNIWIQALISLKINHGWRWEILCVTCESSDFGDPCVEGEPRGTASLAAIGLGALHRVLAAHAAAPAVP